MNHQLITSYSLMSHNKINKSTKKEMFYHFEPLTLFGYPSKVDLKIKFLKEIFVDCRSPSYLEYAQHSINDTTVLNVCATENHCFWFNSRRLCAPPFCRATFKDHAETCRVPCNPLTNRNINPEQRKELLESVCREETKATVAKLVRLPDVEPLLSLFRQEKDRINGKIIILVRDPRAIFTSRRKVNTK